MAAALDRADRTAGGWIADGNYNSHLGGLVRDRADTVIWFDLPRWLVTGSVVRRTVRRALHREVLWNGNREQWTNILGWNPETSIIRWTWTRHAAYRTRLQDAEAAAPPEQRWIRVESRADIDELVGRLRDAHEAR